MMIVRSSEIDAIETPGGNRSRALATPSRGAKEVSVIRQRQIPGGANPPHRHDREEVMVVLSGAVTVTIGDERMEAATGDTVIVPSQMVHGIENTSGGPAEWLIVAPAGVRFFHANGEEATPPWSK